MITIDCHTCTDFKVDIFRVTKNRNSGNCAAMVLPYCLHGNITLTYLGKDGTPIDRPTWQDRDFRVVPHYNCKFLKAARRKKMIQDCELRIDFRGKRERVVRWIDEVNFK